MITLLRYLSTYFLFKNEKGEEQKPGAIAMEKLLGKKSRLA